MPSFLKNNERTKSVLSKIGTDINLSNERYLVEDKTLFDTKINSFCFVLRFEMGNIPIENSSICLSV